MKGHLSTSVNALACAIALLSTPAATYASSSIAKEHVLAEFNNTNGTQPQGAIVRASDGNFYGTTIQGGASNNVGTIYKMTPSGALTTLHEFTGGSDGAFIYAGLIEGPDGDLYGTAYQGGAYNQGTVYKISKSGLFTVLYDFNQQTGISGPHASLVLGNDGNFYGSAVGSLQADGSLGDGAIFRITPSGQLAILHVFSGPDGAGPEAALLLAPDGNFYGTTEVGGTADGEGGTVFKMTPNGTLTTLASFTSASAFPTALTLGPDGNFYGTTGIFPGSVFKITPDGILTTLFTFSGDTNGASPYGSLILGSDGYFYGTTYTGGVPYRNAGTVYRISSDGVLTTLYSFHFWDGAWPASPLLEVKPGLFYGTTLGGGVGVGKLDLFGHVEEVGTVIAVQVPAATAASGKAFRLHR